MPASFPFPYRVPPDCPPALEKYLRELYLTADRLYKQAGSPFGKSDHGMVIWYGYFQFTTTN